MKRTLLALALAVIALPSIAAIQYDYTQKTISEQDTTDLIARAVVDGVRTRVEFLGGNLYPPGTYVVTTDGSRLFFVDPSKKWYTEFNAAGAVSAIGATTTIRVDNVRSDMKELPDVAKVAGVDTKRYRLTMEYDITVVMRGIPMKQSVHTVIEAWTTEKFGSVAHDILAAGMRTGNPEVDRLLDLETTKIPGFPLKQTVSVRTTLLTRSSSSKLQINPTRTMIREMQVSSVREILTSASAFTVPAGFTRADPGDRPNTATEVLSLQPSGQ